MQIDRDIGADRPPRRSWRLPAVTVAGFGAMLGLAIACSNGSSHPAATRSTTAAAVPASAGTTADNGTSATAIDTSLVTKGQRIFRDDTFGDQQFWGDTLQINKAIEGKDHGGVGAGVSPKTALAVGLKVDVDALPQAVVDGLKAGKVNLDDPATTLTLLKLNSVVGVKGFFNPQGNLRSVGITCAVCHSTVDDSLAPGVGHRIDGWANRDLNVGAIVNLSPAGRLQPVANLLHVDEPTVRKVLNSWGPGRFDAEVFLDGKAFRPDGKSASTLIPPAFGLAGVNLHTWTGWGSVTQWNAFVANLEMHGVGTYEDSRLDNAKQFPIAAANKFGHVRNAHDLITSKLPALAAYEEMLTAPTPPAGSFDADAAQRGKKLFAGKAGCATCHVPPLFTEPGFNLHPGSDIGIDNFQADRTPTHMYRTAPLRGLWTHMKGGFYHDGRFATLLDVVNHYNSFQKLHLTRQQKADIVQYLKSL
jgi:mono/diheme cytochrome c family protein